MRAVPVPPLLRDLLAARGPSGDEAEPARVWRESASAFAAVTSDTAGSSFARVPAAGEAGAPTLLIVGHIDEIGIAVTNIEENGLLAFTPIGTGAPEILAGQRFELRTRSGLVPAVVGRRRVSAKEERDRARLELADLQLDIGAVSREDAASRVRLGDTGVSVGPPVELANDRLAGRALDNRLGAYAALEAARRVAEAGGAQVDIVAVAAVQEEIGSYGARIAGYHLEPAAAIAIDVTGATDYPGGDPRLSGAVSLGGGAAIARGGLLNGVIADGLAAVAERDGIPHSFEVYTRITLTDADELHLVRSGVPTGLVSIPLRYMHSPNEVCALADLEATAALVAAYALSLARDADFVR